MPTKTKQLSVRTLQVYIQTLRDAIETMKDPSKWTTGSFARYKLDEKKYCYCAAGAIGKAYRHWKDDRGGHGLPVMYSYAQVEGLADRMCQPGFPGKGCPDSIIEINDHKGREAALAVMEKALSVWQRRLRKALKARKGVAA